MPDKHPKGWAGFGASNTLVAPPRLEFVGWAVRMTFGPVLTTFQPPPARLEIWGRFNRKEFGLPPSLCRVPIMGGWLPK